MIRALVVLIIPISFVAAAVGVALIAVSGHRMAHAGALQNAESRHHAARATVGSGLEKVAVAVCGIIGILGVITLLTNVIRSTSNLQPAFLGLLAIVIVLLAPALLWRTRWRVPAEGLATMAMAGVAVLTGFSIGFAFVPLVVLMILLCARQLRAESSKSGAARA
ncbi:MAG TPA: hypothetical protein VNO75_12280 [Gemmatimonadaceae bacterium]|nr:hypothetical protein [Gemmatimonadaceae bacterium]